MKIIYQCKSSIVLYIVFKVVFFVICVFLLAAGVNHFVHLFSTGFFCAV